MATGMDAASFDIPSGALIELSSNVPRDAVDLGRQRPERHGRAPGFHRHDVARTITGADGNLTGITVAGAPADADLNPAAVNFFLRAPQP